MQKKFLKQIIILIILVAVLILPYFVFAEDKPNNTKSDNTMKGMLNRIGQSGGYKTEGVTETSMAALAGTAVSAFLGLLGIIFIGLILCAGFHWMTAQGEEEKIKKARETMKAAVIGLIVVVGCYTIWWFIYMNFILST